MTEEEKANINRLYEAFGFDPETVDGDYREALHYCNKFWDKTEIDKKFEVKDD